MRGLAFTLGVLAIIASIVLVGLGVWHMQGAGHLEWARPDVKPTIMTFAYKVYGNRDVEKGRFYLSKIRFKNSGNKDIRDFSISYQVPGYIDWTLPDLHPPIRPSQQFIEVFYPQFPKKVTEIKNKTASELDIKLHWHDGVQPHDEVIRQEFAFRGLNEIEYTDVPKEEVTGWFDMMVNLDLTAAMVTPNDPVVAEYAAAITEKLGGALAGAGGAKDVVEVMRGIYYYMTQTGMRYAGALGIPQDLGDYQSTVQTIRLPRDVITTNNGLCIELTLLWASILEHLGVESYCVNVPGHAFIVVKKDNNFIPIECTAITPKAVGSTSSLSFEQAVKLAQKELSQWQEKGAIIVVDVQKCQNDGIVPPELPEVSTDAIKSILADRNKSMRSNGFASSEPAQTQDAGRQGAGDFQTYEGPSGAVRCFYPKNWASVPSPYRDLPELIFGAYDHTGSRVGLEVYHTPNISDPAQALRAVLAALARRGVRSSTIEEKRLETGAVLYSGRSVNRAYTYIWLTELRPTNVGCVAVMVGSPSKQFKSNEQTIVSLIQNIQFP
jgi:Transglutaminase-like superfamily